MKEKDIRTLMPFIIVAVTSFFLSGADLFENFGSAYHALKENSKLLWLLISGDTFQSVIWFLCSFVFFTAWRKNRKRGEWYSEIHWQLSGVFFCWFLLALINIIGIYYRFLWIQGTLRLFVGLFGLYFFNTLWASRKLIYNPPTKDELIEKNKKFEQILEVIGYKKRTTL